MHDLCLIVTATGDPEGFACTMESLCEQTDEEFDVLIVLPGEESALEEAAARYCAEYVGMRLIHADAGTVPGLRNAGVKQTECPLVGFIDCGDYLAPGSVAAYKETYGAQKPDIMSPRVYISGENEPYYEPWGDLLAAVSRADPLDNALLHTLDAPGRIYKKKYFDLYSLTFPEQPILYDAAFLAACVFRCDARVTGVPAAVYDRKQGYFACGIPAGAEPGHKTLAIACAFFDELTDTVKTMLEEETGGFDGDETGFQEVLSVYFDALTERFYRRFWYLADADIAELRRRFEAISALQTPGRREKTAAAHRDLRLPSMYVSRADAAALPMVSLIAETADGEGAADFLASLYNGRFPFFEVFLRDGLQEAVPERLRGMENLRFLPADNFFRRARAEAVGVPINVKDLSPLDPKVLCELSCAKAPKLFFQYLFAAKRKQYSAKTYLKQKGLSMR